MASTSESLLFPVVPLPKRQDVHQISTSHLNGARQTCFDEAVWKRSSATAATGQKKPTFRIQLGLVCGKYKDILKVTRVYNMYNVQY